MKVAHQPLLQSPATLKERCPYCMHPALSRKSLMHCMHIGMHLLRYVCCSAVLRRLSDWRTIPHAHGSHSVRSTVLQPLPAADLHVELVRQQGPPLGRLIKRRGVCPPYCRTHSLPPELNPDMWMRDKGKQARHHMALNQVGWRMALNSHVPGPLS